MLSELPLGESLLNSFRVWGTFLFFFSLSSGFTFFVSLVSFLLSWLSRLSSTISLSFERFFILIRGSRNCFRFCVAFFSRSPSPSPLCFSLLSSLFIVDSDFFAVFQF